MSTPWAGSSGYCIIPRDLLAVSPAAYKVFGAIALSVPRGAPSALITHADIAAQVGVSVPTVRRAIAELIAVKAATVKVAQHGLRITLSAPHADQSGADDQPEDESWLIKAAHQVDHQVDHLRDEVDHQVDHQVDHLRDHTFSLEIKKLDVLDPRGLDPRTDPIEKKMPAPRTDRVTGLDATEWLESPCTASDALPLMRWRDYFLRRYPACGTGTEATGYRGIPDELVDECFREMDRTCGGVEDPWREIQENLRTKYDEVLRTWRWSGEPDNEFWHWQHEVEAYLAGHVLPRSVLALVWPRWAILAAGQPLPTDEEIAALRSQRAKPWAYADGPSPGAATENHSPVLDMLRALVPEKSF